MNIVPTSVLKEGQRFSAPLYFDEGERMFLGANIPLTAREINAAKKWKITRLYTDGYELRGVFESEEYNKTGAEKLLESSNDGQAANSSKTVIPEAAYEVNKSAARAISAAKNSEVAIKLLCRYSAARQNQALYKKYTEIIKRLDSVFTEIYQGSRCRRRAVDGLASEIISMVEANSSDLIAFVINGDKADNSLAKSSVNAAILSAVITQALSMNDVKKRIVAAAALLHDVGMLYVPQKIIEKKGSLTPDEQKIISEHPRTGYKIIVNMLMYPEAVGRAALQAHERWDGSGYPSKIAGSDIDYGARIIAVSAAFEAMISEKPYRTSMIGYEAMKQLLNENARYFDPQILKAFIQRMGIYPIDTIVLLNNAAVARVLEGRGEAPFRPKIQIMIDEQGNAYDGASGPIIDLLQDKSLFIVRAIDSRQYISDG